MYRAIAIAVLMCTGLPLCAAEPADLLDVYELALQADPRLKGSEYTLETAKAQERQALGALLPNVKGFGSYSFNEITQDTPINPTTGYVGRRAGIIAQQVLFDLPAFLEKHRFASQTEQRQEEYVSALKDVMKDVTERYFGVLAAHDALSLVQMEKEATEKEMRRVQQMFKRQLTTITDVYQIEAHYDALLTKEINAQNDLAISLERVRELTGKPFDALEPLLADIQFPPIEGSLDEWVSLSKENSPVLKALIHAIDAAETFVNQQWASHLPSVRLNAQYIYSDTGFDNRQLPPYDNKSVGVEMNFPLYQGGIVEARRREAIARLGVAKETREEQERAIEKQTRTAFLSAQASQSKIRSAEKLVKSAEKAYDSMKKSYALGMATIVDVLKAQKDFFEAKMEQLTAKYEYITSYIQLKHSAGIVSEQDLIEVNQWIAAR